MTNKNVTDLTPSIAIAGGDLTNIRQGSDTEDTKATFTQVKAFTTTTANQISVIGAGTAYSLTATQAAVIFGTTSPAITLTGLLGDKYLLIWVAQLNYNGATFATNRTATLKLTRTNNTATDLTGSTSSLKTDIITGQNYSLGLMSGLAIYTTVSTSDAISLFGGIDTIPTAGTLDVVSGNIIAIRLQQ